jgi:putative addiction module component (TIGR02574 family)
MDQAILEKEALKLTPAERAVLADILLSSLDDENMRPNDAAWGALADQRYSDYKAGKLEAVDGPKTVQELRHRLAQ